MKSEKPENEFEINHKKAWRWLKVATIPKIEFQEYFLIRQSDPTFFHNPLF
jgi:hypothetical protein